MFLWSKRNTSVYFWNRKKKINFEETGTQPRNKGKSQEPRKIGTTFVICSLLSKLNNTNVLKLKLQFYHYLEDKTSCIWISQCSKKMSVVLLNTYITLSSNYIHIIPKDLKQLKI